MLSTQPLIIALQEKYNDSCPFAAVIVIGIVMDYVCETK